VKIVFYWPFKRYSIPEKKVAACTAPISRPWDWSHLQTPHPLEIIFARWCRREVLLGVSIIWQVESSKIGRMKTSGGTTILHDNYTGITTFILVE
jgi:hypothetical protein